MINVICVRWGNKYGPEYVDQLHRMVEKHLDVPYEFHCYEGQDDGLEEWWPKLRLFEKGRFKGKCLYFDLDTVIQNNITHLTEYEDFHLIKAYWKGGYKESADFNMDINSSCMVWDGDENAHIWEYFWENADYYMTKYKGIDRFMYHEGLINKVFPKGIFYSRLHGAVEGDETKTQPPWWYLPDYDVCMMNGMHKLTTEDFEWAQPYAGLEQYQI